MRMRTLGLQVVAICVFLQVPGCFPSCLIVGSVANCASKNLRHVPPLPPHITHLYLEFNRISEINSTSLSGLEELQELDLGRQYSRLAIRNNAFSGQSRLRRLVLGYNKGLQLEPQAFEGLSGLQNLYLDYCSLTESILEDNFLEPLSSLETLDLMGNQIKRLRPSLFFANMTNLKELNLKLNTFDKVCESDLVGFRGKHFTVLNLNSVYLKAMSRSSFDWKSCGNPFRGMSIETLDLAYIGLSASKSKRFFKAIEGTKISHLKFSSYIGKGFSFSNLPDVDRSTFEGLKSSSVLSLDLSKSKISALHGGVFSLLGQVEIIDMSQNEVNQIHKDAFEGLEDHLKVLNLSHNLLGEIHSHTFESLTNLRVLDLSYNHIGVLGFHSFIGLNNLKALNLTGNSLRKLGLPAPLNLDYLTLNDNKLTSLLENNFLRLADTAIHLDVRDNRLTDLGEFYRVLILLDHVQHLYYGGNTIRECEWSMEVGPNNIQHLDLHGSSLQSVWAQGRCLNLFDDLGNVTSLNLSFNALQSLPRRIFKGLTSVVEMDLSSNALTHLQPDVLPKSLKTLDLSNNFIASPDPAAFSSLSSLDLRMNRFICNADLKSFLTWLDKTNVTLLSPVQELKCSFPFNFYNVPVLDYSARVAQQ